MFRKDNEKELQKELKRMDKEDEKLAKELEREFAKRDDKERDYELDAETDKETMLYLHDYNETAAENDDKLRLKKDSEEEAKALESIKEDIDSFRNKSEKRFERHLRKEHLKEKN